MSFNRSMTNWDLWSPTIPSIGAVNLNFHSALTEAAGVPLLTHLIRQLWAALPMGPQARGRPVSESVRQHQSDHRCPAYG